MTTSESEERAILDGILVATARAEIIRKFNRARKRRVSQDRFELVALVFTALGVVLSGVVITQRGWWIPSGPDRDAALVLGSLFWFTAAGGITLAALLIPMRGSLLRKIVHHLRRSHR